MNVLVLNSGSSSLKFQGIATELERIKQYQDDRICRGEIEGIGGEAIIRIQHLSQPVQTFTAPLGDVPVALDYLVRYIASDRSGISEIKSTADEHAVGHRVVRGGELFDQSALIDDKVLKGIEDCIDLAPLRCLFGTLHRLGTATQSGSSSGRGGLAHGTAAPSSTAWAGASLRPRRAIRCTGLHRITPTTRHSH